MPTEAILAKNYTIPIFVSMELWLLMAGQNPPFLNVKGCFNRFGVKKLNQQK